LSDTYKIQIQKPHLNLNLTFRKSGGEIGPKPDLGECRKARTRLG
jgi:hypothetical protein